MPSAPPSEEDGRDCSPTFHPDAATKTITKMAAKASAMTICSTPDGPRCCQRGQPVPAPADPPGRSYEPTHGPRALGVTAARTVTPTPSPWTGQTPSLAYLAARFDASKVMWLSRVYVREISLTQGSSPSAVPK